MPDLGNLLLPSVAPPTVVVQHGDPSCSSSSFRRETLDGNSDLDRRWSSHLRFAISKGSSCAELKRDQSAKIADGKSSLEDHVREWKEKRIASGVPERECTFPFLTNAPRTVDCRMCNRPIFPGDEIRCTVVGCQEGYHLTCVKQMIGPTCKPFKCPQHGCFICKQKGHWRCVRCEVAAHAKCAPWPMNVIYLKNQPGRAVCWRHSSDWRLEKEHADPTSDVKEALLRLPLPYADEEFKMGSILKDVMDKTEPAPYVHIRRNIYLIKKKRDGSETSGGCTNCNPNSTCQENCECRGLSISCSKDCHCSDMCRNRPFRKEKKTKVVKTEYCGWGVVALEVMEKGDFIIEYIGEVIDDALCEKRLWDMKHRGDQNFYMCELHKDFTIDATFKGNTSRFLNHSCHPNCKLEKWQVDGETRVGVFASRSIEIGEPLTYDYRFVHFGPMVRCYCGASNCQGYLGSKKKISQIPLSWGCKRKRSIMVLRDRRFS
ncbi:histone-lysine N-methyltransferase ASHR3-like [Zingiber officinale]|uniref:histone-lysine N-methyltransferase ASHR3-like n=1 Tax=Zingiber officinale TaxID=94328 RepID=UPI001C4C8A66|nr:histone-lysine N-methyltransferase ASHR3-like [Zingiber officinale]XP_042468302.1 histone-lysine N-methyltransferase ASHR3-like [Zingiber officinale]